MILLKFRNAAYKIDLPLDYGVSNTFNVIDLTLYDVGTYDINSMANSSQEGENDGGLSNEEEFDLGGLNKDEPITRVRIIDFKKSLKFSHGKKRRSAKLMNFSQLLG